MTEQEIERCLERFTMGKATDVMNFDYSGTLAYLQRLKAENAELREKLDKSQKRVAVLERAIKIYQDYYGDVRFFNFDVAIKQAEKELNGDK